MSEKTLSIQEERKAFEVHKLNFRCAENIADEILNDGSLNIADTESIIEEIDITRVGLKEEDAQQLNQDEIQKMVRLLVYSASEIPHIIDRNRYFDMNRIVSFNHALRDIITEFADTYLTPEALIRSIMTYAIGRGWVEDRAREAVLEGLSSDFIGAWNEQAFENMAILANIPNQFGDISEDRRGRDIYIGVQPQRPSSIGEYEWLSVDIKSSRNSLSNYTSPDGAISKLRVIKDQDKSIMDASYDNPVISVLHDDEHFLISVDYGNKPGNLPDQITAPSYKQFDSHTVAKIFDVLLDYMQNSSVQRYEFKNGEFKQESGERYIGRLAAHS
jgi:hypothetical protein